MKKLNNLKWFLLGILVCFVVTVFAVPAIAAVVEKQATLTYNDIKITLDGVTVIPKDAAGNVVEPFVIDGTTFLPVRAIANALGIRVEWDGVTKTVRLSTSGQEEPTATSEPTPTPTPAPTPTPTPSTSTGTGSLNTVYITPTGKRYHRLASCAGKNAWAVSITEVGSRTACGTCVK